MRNLLQTNASGGVGPGQRAPGCPGWIGSRAALAGERVRVARVEVSCCQWCAHGCGVDRRRGEVGLCGAGAEGRVFSAQIEVSDELAFVPVFAIALSGCDLRCDFCITGAQSWDAASGETVAAEEVARCAEIALAQGARSVMILGGEPTIHLVTVLEIVAALPDDALLIWKTNGHGSSRARALLEGLFDVWVVDYKFGNDRCARRLSGWAGYVRVAEENLRWAWGEVALVVRHVLMPGHLDCCWRPVAEWLGSELPGVKVNLRTGFWPAWRAVRHGELCGGLRAWEVDQARSIARDCHLNLIE